ncbi:MAG: VOC family protein [Pyrinomonadaceae bacterium]
MSENTAAAAEQMAMPKHGEFCWNELASNNLEACKTFYAELFGWQFKENEPMAGMDCDGAGMIYNEISIDGKKQFGGMYQMGKEFGETPPHWMSYIAVDDVDASVEKVAELGGSVCVPPMDIPNTGRFCVINDPSGATVSLITLKY